MDDELKGPYQRRFDGGAVDLAVPLCRMGIAGKELRAIMKYRQEKASPRRSALLKSNVAPHAMGGAS